MSKCCNLWAQLWGMQDLLFSFVWQTKQNPKYQREITHGMPETTATDNLCIVEYELHSDFFLLFLYFLVGYMPDVVL